MRQQSIGGDHGGNNQPAAATGGHRAATTTAQQNCNSIIQQSKITINWPQKLTSRSKTAKSGKNQSAITKTSIWQWQKAAVIVAQRLQQH